MSDNAIALPPHTVADDEWGSDGPLRIIAANGENGLNVKVVDVRAEAPNAFPPRTVNDRVVTDTASFLAEIARRPLIEGLSTVWGTGRRGRLPLFTTSCPVPRSAITPAAATG